jgi:hypothetical protein
MLGHKSAKVTLDTYSDLFDDDLDAVADTLHARYSREVTVTAGSYSKLWAKCRHKRGNKLVGIHQNSHSPSNDQNLWMSLGEAA